MFAGSVAVTLGILVAALALQARLLRTYASLRVATTLQTAFPVVVSRGALAIVILGIAALAIGERPVLFVIAVLLGGVLVKTGTLLADVLRVRRFAAQVERGEFDVAGTSAIQIVRKVSRLGNAAPASNIAAMVLNTYRVFAGESKAAALIAGISRDGLSWCVRWAVELQLAQSMIAQSNYVEARAALSMCLGGAPTSDLGDLLELLTARLDASTGSPDVALKAAHARKGPEWECVRAHAYAAKNQTAQAVDTLERLRSEHGDDWLRAIAERDGPAKALAEKLLGGTVYRD
jgi:hypothetical protein